jgi:hypothetical protein
MKFLIQKINGEIRHDFAFALIQATKYHNWLHPNEIKIKYVDFNEEIPEPDDIYPIPFKSFHGSYVPVGSVEFVTNHLQHFYNLVPKPINVPEELFRHPSFDFTMRKIFNGNHMDLEDLKGKWFVKSNDKIKGFSEVLRLDDNHSWNIPVGNYQISEYINIDSEWRAFVYDSKLVGLQNYCGDFTKFPSIGIIEEMISAYKSAPIAYTLDVGVGKGIYHEKYGFHLHNETFVIEVHDFFSCGLYGFNSTSYPYMLHRWYKEYIKKHEPEDKFSKYKNSSFFKNEKV